jgi:glycerophosphoryl diester phosphodiesterase
MLIKKLLVIILGSLLLGGLGYWLCSDYMPSDFEVTNLENGKVNALGHGGMGTRSWHTINTRGSFAKTVTTSADGTEMDTQLTADGVLVAFHDEHVGESKCLNTIAQHTYAQLKACNRGLMKVEEVLALGWKNGSIFSLDIKLHGSDTIHAQGFAPRIAALKARFPHYRILVESTDVDFLVRMKNQGISEGIYYYTDIPDAALYACIQHGFEGISIRSERISKEEIAQCHARFVRVMLWGTGSRWDNRTAVLKSPDFIQTDKLPHLVSLLTQVNP